MFDGILNFFRPAKTAAQSPYRWFSGWFGGSSSSGVQINDDSALGVNSVYACCRTLSGTIASLPIQYFSKHQDGSVLPVSGRPEINLFDLEPSLMYSPFTFLQTLQLHVMLRGNGYALIHRDEFGQPLELEIIEPSCIEPFRHERKIWYDIKTDDIDGVFPSSDVIHLKNMSKNGVMGLSPIQAAREDIGISIAAKKYAGATMRNGSAVKGLLETDKTLKTEQVQQVRESFQAIMAGPDNAGNIPVLQDGMKFRAISLSPADSKFIEMSKMTVGDIARLYGIPPHKIGDLERATFSNIEAQAIEFVTDCVRPLVKMWEHELNRKLVPVSKRGKYFFKFNLEGLLRGDSQARAKFFTSMFQIGIFSVNEIRALEGLNKIPNGDRHYVQLNMADVGDLPEDKEEDGEKTADITTEPAAA